MSWFDLVNDDLGNSRQSGSDAAVSEQQGNMSDKMLADKSKGRAAPADDPMKAMQRRVRQSSGRARMAAHEPIPIVSTLAWAGLAALATAYVLQLQDWKHEFGSYDLAVRHTGAAAGCEVSSYLELGRAYDGQPGYWRHIDVDKDGWVC